MLIYITVKTYLLTIKYLCTVFCLWPYFVLELLYYPSSPLVLLCFLFVIKLCLFSIPFGVSSSLLVTQTFLKVIKILKFRVIPKAMFREVSLFTPNTTLVPSSHPPQSVSIHFCGQAILLDFISCVSFHTNGQIHACFLIVTYVFHNREHNIVTSLLQTQFCLIL